MHFDNKAITFFGVAFQQLYLYIPFVTLLVNYVSILLPQCTTLYLKCLFMYFLEGRKSLRLPAYWLRVDHSLVGADG